MPFWAWGFVYLPKSHTREARLIQDYWMGKRFVNQSIYLNLYLIFFSFFHVFLNPHGSQGDLFKMQTWSCHSLQKTVQWHPIDLGPSLRPLGWLTSTCSTCSPAASLTLCSPFSQCSNQFSQFSRLLSAQNFHIQDSLCLEQSSLPVSLTKFCLCLGHRLNTASLWKLF